MKGVSLLGVGICSVPEMITEVVLSFTRAVSKLIAELSILFLKRSEALARWPAMPAIRGKDKTGDAVFVDANSKVTKINNPAMVNPQGTCRLP